MDRSLGNEIQKLFRVINRKIENSPVKKQVDSMTGANAWIIGYIMDHKDRDVFQKDLERDLKITRSTASKVVNLMEKKEFIRRESVPGDARLKKLVLLPKAQEVYELMKTDFQDVENTLMEGFSPEELNRLFEYLHRMQANIEVKEKGEGGTA